MVLLQKGILTTLLTAHELALYIFDLVKLKKEVWNKVLRNLLANAYKSNLYLTKQ